MRAHVPALLHRVITVAGAIGGLALPASAAEAQVGPSGDQSVSQGDNQTVRPAGQAQSGASVSNPPTVGGVIVQAPRQPSKLGEIPPDKKAAYDEEVAKAEVWKRYRKSTPPATASTLDQANDYPGLQSLLPPP